ncbi:hypothetical protein HAX54_016872 [Datura stramonium]|uniref:Uncharacterized protein n=1 Tax=Datura stramonium TaxID=4076 RepID=A0ABS8RIY3_DATST|nr:hypothetical protein [Datura stramonium]
MPQRQEAAMRLAADSMAAKSGADLTRDCTEMGFSSSPMLLNMPNYISDNNPMGLMSDFATTTNNTDTSIEDDGMSVIFADSNNLWNPGESASRINGPAVPGYQPLSSCLPIHHDHKIPEEEKQRKRKSYELINANELDESQSHNHLRIIITRGATIKLLGNEFQSIQIRFVNRRLW